MGVFTQVAPSIKGFACKFVCKSAYVFCVNGALGGQPREVVGGGGPGPVVWVSPEVPSPVGGVTLSRDGGGFSAFVLPKRTCILEVGGWAFACAMSRE